MYDVIVIGGGPAGVTAALRARELGASVALVERGRLGGTCTNDGCAPTRVLARAARLMRVSGQFAEYGLIAERPKVDFPRLMARAQEVIYELHEKKQLIAHLQGVHIDVFHGVGDASFVDQHHIRLGDGTELEAEKFIICVGGHARRLDFPGAEVAILPQDVWTMERLPESIVIVGGGATGCQLASCFHVFGSRVTLLDIAPRLLPPEDDSVSTAITKSFRRRGIEVITGIEGIRRIERSGERLRLVYGFDGGERARLVEAVIMSVGWPANLEKLNLPAVGVETKGPYIVVDDYLCTSVPNIYAAGDVNGRMMLVQSAGHQARYAAENAILGAGRKEEHALVPHGGFTDPEYASVGMTEAQARQQGDPAVAIVPYSDTDRGVIDALTTGFCKLIVDRDSRLILGAHVVGEQAVEVVQIVAAAMAGAMRIEQFADLQFAYPTYSAIIGLAARQLARELDAVPLAVEWRALTRQRIAEWERDDAAAG